MKTRPVQCISRVLVIGLISQFFVPFVWGAEKKNDFPKVGPGLTYIHERIGDGPWSIHVLKIDRSRNDLKFTTTLARQTVFGLERLTRQIENIPPESGTPLAAVNGDFFRIKKGPYRGDLCGLMIRQGEIISENPDKAISFWIDAKGEPKLGPVKSDFQIIWPGNTKTPFKLNQERYDNAAVLYTPTMGESTRTEDGVELVLGAVDSKNWLPMQVGETIRAKVKSISQKGNTPLSPNIMVLSISPKLVKKLPTIKKGEIITLTTATYPSLKNVKTAIGVNALLINKGQVQKPINKVRHPRTLIGWNEKSFFFVVVDGRQEGLSKGMSYKEETDLMLRLGATEAVNLDGGGSSTFWLGGQVMNSPSDGRERSVANGLVLLRKTSSTKRK